MNYYISDVHFGHQRIIELENRPFSSIEEMDEKIIELWNETVSDEDDVWILGDLIFKSDKSPDDYLERLKGKKHLIVGNHDDLLLDAKYKHYFESIDDIKIIEDHGVSIVLCHYPMIDWKNMRYGYYHFYGHIHIMDCFATDIMKQVKHAYNAGCMLHKYKPASFKEMTEEEVATNKVFEI